MATEAFIGHGSIFSWGTTATPAVFTPLAEVISITGPALARDVVDATHMASPEKWREFIGGLRDAGEISLEMNFIPESGASDMNVLFTAFASDVVNLWKITFPNAFEWEFDAWLTGVDTETPLDDKMSMTATFKLTGKPAFFVTGSTALAEAMGATKTITPGELAAAMPKPAEPKPANGKPA